MNPAIDAALAATARRARTKPVARATVGEGPNAVIFPFDAKTQSFSGDASEFGRFVQTGWVSGRRVSRIELTSGATGNVAVFMMAREERDREDELLFTEFQPTAQAVRNNPGLAGVVVRLFND